METRHWAATKSRRRLRTWCGRQQPRRRGQTWRWLRRFGSPCPGLRTTSAAPRGGQGGGGAGRFRLAERGDLSPSSLRNRQRLRTQHPRPRAPPRCRLSPPPMPRAGRDPHRRARFRHSRLARGKMPRGGRKFIRPKTPPRRWERKLPERYALGCLSVEAKAQDFHPTTWTRVASPGRSARSKRHFSPSPLATSEPLLLPVHTVPAFSHLQ